MAPSRHPPIKRYNYERSLFRWVMARHPEAFEKHGITTRTLERAPRAREAFYTSEWPGARALVQSTDESKFERTPFFDTIIERGLRGGTKFNIDHVTPEEKNRLGISMDSSAGKYYLAVYGGPRIGRGSGRRGSQTSQASSDGDVTDQHTPRERQHHHSIMKDVGETLMSELEAAGENVEVDLQKALTPGPGRGSKLLTFAISIRRRSHGKSNSAAKPDALRSGRGSARSTEQVTSPSAPSSGGVRSQANAATASSPGGKEGRSPPQSGKSGSSGAACPSQSSQSSQKQPKVRARPVAGAGSASREARDGDEATHEVSRKRKSITQLVFPSSPKAKSSATPAMMPITKQEAEPAPSPDELAIIEARFPRVGNPLESRTKNLGPARGKPSYLPGGLANMTEPLNQFGGASLASSPRAQGFSSGESVSSWAPTLAQDHSGGVMGTGTSRTTSQCISSMNRGANDLSGVPPPPPPNASSWGMAAASIIRHAEYDPSSLRLEALEAGGPSGQGLGSLSVAGSALPQQAQTLGLLSPTSMHMSDAVAPIQSYSEQLRQQSRACGGLNSWGMSPRASVSVGDSRDPDEEDMDFLAAFF